QEPQAVALEQRLVEHFGIALLDNSHLARGHGLPHSGLNRNACSPTRRRRSHAENWSTIRIVTNRRSTSASVLAPKPREIDSFSSSPMPPPPTAPMMVDARTFISTLSSV